MNKNKVRFWLPRLLAVIYIIFISIFALDSFNSQNWLMALLIHLMPSILLIVLTTISWKYTVLGGVSFLLISLGFLAFFHSFWLTLPLTIIGIFFLTEQKSNIISIK